MRQEDFLEQRVILYSHCTIDYDKETENAYIVYVVGSLGYNVMYSGI
jgi:hypothetical protein